MGRREQGADAHRKPWDISSIPVKLDERFKPNHLITATLTDANSWLDIILLFYFPYTQVVTSSTSQKSINFRLAGSGEKIQVRQLTNFRRQHRNAHKLRYHSIGYNHRRQLGRAAKSVVGFLFESGRLSRVGRLKSLEGKRPRHEISRLSSNKSSIYHSSSAALLAPPDGALLWPH